MRRRGGKEAASSSGHVVPGGVRVSLSGPGPQRRRREKWSKKSPRGRERERKGRRGAFPFGGKETKVHLWPSESVFFFLSFLFSFGLVWFIWFRFTSYDSLRVCVCVCEREREREGRGVS